jgi:cyclophilin family peptidyl-prolyl cis-trans isomerase
MDSCQEKLMLRSGLLTIVLGALVASAAPVQEKNPVVIVDTSKGQIKIELFKDKAPTTVKNFLKYVEEEHYDNTIFHRVIKDFMIQGGGFTADMKQKPTHDPIKNEAANGLSNVRGTIAMARTPNPDSATCQFFINVKDNTQLDRKDGAGNDGYCVFGHVVEGIDVVDQIRAVETGAKDVPVQPVVIKRIRLVKQ